MSAQKTYFFDLRSESILRSAGDLAHELVEFALAENTVPLTFKLERWELVDHGLTHLPSRTVGGSGHCGSSLAHGDRGGRGDIESAWNWQLRIVQLFAFPAAWSMEIALSGLHRSVRTLSVLIRVGSLCSTHGCLM